MEIYSARFQMLSEKFQNWTKTQLQNVFLGKRSTVLFNTNLNVVLLNNLNVSISELPQVLASSSGSTKKDLLPDLVSLYLSLVPLAVYQVNRQKLTGDNFRNLPKKEIFKTGTAANFLGFNQNFKIILFPWSSCILSNQHFPVGKRNTKTFNWNSCSCF